MIYESGEDYLETILLLWREKGYVRSIDIAAKLSFTKASVSRAMGILRQNGYILMDKSGQITLTEAGEKKSRFYLQPPYPFNAVSQRRAGRAPCRGRARRLPDGAHHQP